MNKEADDFTRRPIKELIVRIYRFLIIESSWSASISFFTILFAVFGGFYTLGLHFGSPESILVSSPVNNSILSKNLTDTSDKNFNNSTQALTELREKYASDLINKESLEVESKKEIAALTQIINERNTQIANLKSEYDIAQLNYQSKTNILTSKINKLEIDLSELQKEKKVDQVLHNTDKPSLDNVSKSNITSHILHIDNVVNMHDGVAVVMKSFSAGYDGRKDASFYVNGREVPRHHIGQKFWPSYDQRDPCHFLVVDIQGEPKKRETQLTKVNYICTNN